MTSDERSTWNQAKMYLTKTYRKMDNAEADWVLLQCQDMGADLFFEAVQRHIKNPNGGQFTPVPADIAEMASIIIDEREAAVAAQRAADNEQIARNAVPQGEGVRVIPLPAWLQKQIGRATIEVTNAAPTVCKDCSGSGWARFYYHQGNRKLVWTAPEWLQLHATDELRAMKLDCASAVCTCDAGILLRRLPKVAVLEKITALSKRRKALEDLQGVEQLIAL